MASKSGDLRWRQSLGPLVVSGGGSVRTLGGGSGGHPTGGGGRRTGGRRQGQAKKFVESKLTRKRYAGQRVC
jgi:hypothetical protein